MTPAPRTRSRSRRRRSVALLALAVLIIATPSRAAEIPSADIVIRVRDATGLPVAATASAQGQPASPADRSGEIRIPRPAAAASVTIAAPGLQPQVRRVGPDSPPRLEVVLQPAGLAERVTVTATRREGRLADAPASLVTVTRAELDASGALTLDDALRQVPGFALFRRTGSQFANPTSQGVSLRGVGASGASRALVLDDGVPLNDPFGGWVYWSRLPRLAVERVEVLRGGGADLYGGGALGGVVQLVRAEPGRSALSADLAWGSAHTPSASLLAAGLRGAWRATLAAEAFETDGYVAVPEALRGRVDTPLSSRHAAADATLERDGGGAARVFLRGSVYGESRHNGTPLQVNDTRIAQLAAGADWRAARGLLAARAWGSTQAFDQDFSQVAADRGSERLTRSQHTPAAGRGLSLVWSGAAGRTHAVLAGVEARQASGEPEETVFAGGSATHTLAHGRQRTGSAFVEDIATVASRLTLTAAVRGDTWTNRGAPPAAAPRASTSRSETALSPRLGALFQLSTAVALHAGAYRAFRPPTLNELYRPFRVGNVLTLANADLRAERLSGVEAGVAASAGSRVRLRANAFRMRVSEPVANVTLTTAAGLITRMRRNLGATRTVGIEVDAEALLPRGITLSAGYLLSDATVLRAADPALVGNALPQVSKHQASVQVRAGTPRRGTVSLQARWASRTFDDDQNRLPLGGYAVVDALAERSLRGGLAAFLAVENLADARCDVARTPLLTVGPPRSVRAGIRLRLSRG